MNLLLSLQAACTARDRLEAHNGYEINRKAEEE
jgi:uncharacterized membrane protein